MKLVPHQEYPVTSRRAGGAESASDGIDDPQLDFRLVSIENSAEPNLKDLSMPRAQRTDPADFPFSPSADHQIPFNLVMHSTKNGADKIYEIDIEPDADPNLFHVICYYGKRRASLRTERKTDALHPVIYQEARKIVLDVLSEKIGKDYKPIESRTGHWSGDPGSFTVPGDTGYRPQLFDVMSEAHLDKMVSDPGFVMQEDVGGDRRFLFCILQETGGFSIYGANGKGIETTGLPDTVKAQLRPRYSFILDGKESGPDFHALDLIMYDDRDVRSEPLEERLRLLEQVLTENVAPFRRSRSHIKSAKIAIDEAGKASLLSDIMQQEGDGVVFKRRGSIYSDHKSHNHLRLKFWNTLNAIVMEIHVDALDKNSAIVGLLDETGNLKSVGHIAIPAHLPVLPPGSIAEIRYRNAISDSGGRLNAPSLMSYPKGVDQSTCTMDQLVYPGASRLSPLEPQQAPITTIRPVPKFKPRRMPAEIPALAEQNKPDHQTDSNLSKPITPSGTRTSIRPRWH
jgi:hypothetical protein